MTISEKKVRTAIEKMSPAGVTDIDHRSKKEPPNKIQKKLET